MLEVKGSFLLANIITSGEGHRNKCSKTTSEVSSMFDRCHVQEVLNYSFPEVVVKWLNFSAVMLFILLGAAEQWHTNKSMVSVT